MQKPKLIVFEGIDGSGKSTQARRLHEKLTIDNPNTILTSEPSNWHTGKLLRNIFSGKEPGDDYIIAGLFVADRLHHITNKKDGLLKQLAANKTVICDRYVFSSYAYQGAHVDMNWVIQANAQACKILKADVHLFIDVPPEVCVERIAKRAGTIERYENLENLKLVRAKYFEAFEKLKDNENIIIIDGNRNSEVIASEILSIINSM
jgi:dTMP kinase